MNDRVRVREILIAILLIQSQICFADDPTPTPPAETTPTATPEADTTKTTTGITGIAGASAGDVSRAAYGDPWRTAYTTVTTPTPDPTPPGETPELAPVGIGIAGDPTDVRGSSGIVGTNAGKILMNARSYATPVTIAGYVAADPATPVAVVSSTTGVTSTVTFPSGFLTAVQAPTSVAVQARDFPAIQIPTTQVTTTGLPTVAASTGNLGGATFIGQPTVVTTGQPMTATTAVGGLPAALAQLPIAGEPVITGDVVAPPNNVRRENANAQPPPQAPPQTEMRHRRDERPIEGPGVVERIFNEPPMNERFGDINLRPPAPPPLLGAPRLARETQETERAPLPRIEKEIEKVSAEFEKAVRTGDSSALQAGLGSLARLASQQDDPVSPEVRQRVLSAVSKFQSQTAPRLPSLDTTFFESAPVEAGFASFTAGPRPVSSAPRKSYLFDEPLVGATTAEKSEKAQAVAAALASEAQKFGAKAKPAAADSTGKESSKVVVVETQLASPLLPSIVDIPSSVKGIAEDFLKRMLSLLEKTPALGKKVSRMRRTSGHGGGLPGGGGGAIEGSAFEGASNQFELPDVVAGFFTDGDEKELGVGFGGVLLFSLLATLFFFRRKRRRNEKLTKEESHDDKLVQELASR